MKIALLAFLALPGGCLLTGCEDGGDSPRPVVKTALLVYLGGDNNLSRESRDKFDAIARGFGGAPDGRLLIYLDPKDDAPSLHEAGGNGTTTLVEQYGEENSADPRVFSRVIGKAKGLYPQAALNLLVFSHASGWLPAGSLANPGSTGGPRSVVTDNGEEMALAELAAAIPDGAFDWIVFETCFMAGIEVAYALRYKTNYIAASSAEIVSPGFTPLYERHIGELAGGDPLEFMREAFAHYDRQTGYMRSATFSVTATARLDALASFVREHCDFGRQEGIDPAAIQHFDRGASALFSDFGDYYGCLVEGESLKQQLRQLIGECVVWKASTPFFMQGYNGFAVDSHSGLTAYAKQQRYPVLNECYTALEWHKAVTR